MSDADLFEVPAAVSRLGEGLFLKLPLYRTEKAYRVLYVNEELFEKYFGQLRFLPWEEKADFLSRHFSFTLSPTGAKPEQIGWGYADRQSDPFHISMGGNLGSGRAYYAGKHFNIKGEKTPLATSAIRRLSDGFLEAERGIWETIAANALKRDFESGASPVLAILDMGETCSVEWREQPVPRVKIVRIDDEGSLDRITHVFYNKSRLAKDDLFRIADKFARLEAEKFIHRILHGAWSAGNISVDGGLIDFDTVCAVKGRAPSFSATPWHQENYFGFEYKGQIKVLEMLASDPEINRDSIDAPELASYMQTRMEQHAAEQFVFLMGFKNSAHLFGPFRDEVADLYRSFRDLAGLFYPRLDGLSLRDEACGSIHVVDFSCFFRLYPILLRTKSFFAAHAIALMTVASLPEDPFAKTYLPVVEDDRVEEFFENVVKQFTRQLVLAPAMRDKALSDLRRFVVDYEAVFAKMMAASGENAFEIEARAYILNEDRFYFFPCYSPAYNVSKKIGKLGERQLHRLIDLCITAVSRRPEKDFDMGYKCDIRMYNEGCFYRLLDATGGHRTCFCLFKKPNNHDGAADGFEFMVNGENLTHTVINAEDKIDIMSSRQDNKMLALKMKRDRIFEEMDVALRFKGRPIPLSDILCGGAAQGD